MDTDPERPFSYYYLNPIEDLWDELEWRLCPISVSDLINSPQNEWAIIPTETQQHIIGRQMDDQLHISLCTKCNVIKVYVGVMTRCPSTYFHIVYLYMDLVPQSQNVKLHIRICAWKSVVWHLCAACSGGLHA